MSLRFAIHLAKTGKISAKQLVDAIDLQTGTRPQIGQLALQEGQLSMSQLFEVLGAQRLERKRFGRIAVELGFLTKTQLATLLAKQSEMESSVADLLVELGAIGKEELVDLHDQWMRESRRGESIAAGRSSAAHIESNVKRAKAPLQAV